MPDFSPSQLDVATYLVPGYLVLLAGVYALTPDRLRSARDKVGVGEVIASIIVALVIGLTIHRVADVVPFVSRVIHGQEMLIGIVERFEHADNVREKVDRHLGFHPRDLVDSYYYGRVLIDERAPRTALIAERLTSLALLCRNMMVAIPLALFIVSGKVFTLRRGRITLVGLVVCAFVLEYFFLRGFRAYWSAAVWRILRGVLTLT